MLTLLAHMGETGEMMGSGWGMMGSPVMMGQIGLFGQSLFWLWGLLWLVTWILLILAFVALIRWLWKKGNK